MQSDHLTHHDRTGIRLGVVSLVSSARWPPARGRSAERGPTSLRPPGIRRRCGWSAVCKWHLNRTMSCSPSPDGQQACWDGLAGMQAATRPRSPRWARRLYRLKLLLPATDPRTLGGPAAPWAAAGADGRRRKCRPVPSHRLDRKGLKIPAGGSSDQRLAHTRAAGP